MSYTEVNDNGILTINAGNSIFNNVTYSSDEWNVYVADNEVLTVAVVGEFVLVHFNADDKYAFSVTTYTVGASGSGLFLLASLGVTFGMRKERKA